VADSRTSKKSSQSGVLQR